ncbi:hypothetical protein CHL76_02535 [Marinococcus halophilus]|nr:hypothetical protein CHL76_02535 [Marinococcus halophilus]
MSKSEKGLKRPDRCTKIKLKILTKSGKGVKMIIIILSLMLFAVLTYLFYELWNTNAEMKENRQHCSLLYGSSLLALVLLNTSMLL